MEAKPVLVIRSPHPVTRERYADISATAKGYICFVLFRPQLDDYIFETYNVNGADEIDFEQLKQKLTEVVER